jgi:hypothetical protein
VNSLEGGKQSLFKSVGTASNVMAQAMLSVKMVEGNDDI